jgi:copper resistance protein B
MPQHIKNRICGYCLIIICLLMNEAQAAEEHDPVFAFFQADRFEYRNQDGRDSLKWDAQGWYGGDTDKLWLKTEGEKPSNGKIQDAEVQLLYSRLWTDFFNVLAGVRYDPQPEPRRAYAVLGVQGLAPYYVETDAALFLSNKGDLSARLKGEYELLLTQRLVLQPAMEINLAAQDEKARGIAAGLTDIELGLRLRYEMTGKFAPYIGVNWERKLGQTADMARDAGDDIDVPAFVAGIRFWF